MRLVFLWFFVYLPKINLLSNIVNFVDITFDERISACNLILTIPGFTEDLIRDLFQVISILKEKCLQNKS